MVTGEAKIRAYPGAHVYSSTGRAPGTLCVADRIVRQFRETDPEVLQDFASVIEDMFRLRGFTLAYNRRRK